MPDFADLNTIADGIIRAVLTAADPGRAVRDHFPAELDRAARITLLATGKASAPMVEAALDRLGRDGRARITAGAITCVPDHGPRIHAALAGLTDRVAVLPADHPLATDRNTAAARAIAQAAGRAAERDTVLALVSGGASAHLTLPAGDLSLEDIRGLTRALLRAGAPIGELNAVRKHLEQLKGGGLARLIHPAGAHVLVLSDVLGDPLDTIGSGPTAPDPTTYAQALDVLERRGLTADHPRPVAHLRRGAAGEIPETPKPGDPVFQRIAHTVIANNRAAIDAATAAARDAGFTVHAVREQVEGEAAEVARELVAALARLPRPAAIVIGGETTVTVGASTGLGGRNQELALAAALALEAVPDAALIALATDGIDGPTDAAGAVVSSRTASALRAAGLDPQAALSNHDSHHALDRVRALIRTGPTGTNINDIAVALLF